ncbi:MULTISPECIES: MTAP family purine nucleoside phosphorylase [unclassified Cryobacterium]|uniref:MTAP family purine nucleoside phosphorylase n=1 Tax=unclassified Cryobacterium TaxID=2649013 RepID=UPI002AB4AD02|nr:MULTISPECIES: MTAP family purine nucleoside phosphorylase [unclassified Cryobacterium]MDY7526697.1 MTAP family purine nucleoside phosphorylase [Cryobacterium sp. 10C2]MDY7557498.1 MTAP family purine nucleoside phosphorylase [Cryobacterium sp. 10C3]MEB0291486.1 MTAP family purine nucleoside phosphorylase [Cryobacterium sp. 10C2]
MTEQTPAQPLAHAPVEIAVIGGSGLYRLFDAGTVTSIIVDTPYGPTSAPITVGERAGRRVAFLPRHGAGHTEAPHRINYRANIWALASLGVRAIISSSAVGGVSPEYPPGLLVVTDQFIDRTSGRADTFFDEGVVAHLAAADPFDPVLRRTAVAALNALGERFAPTGTVVVIQGPRFSTRAESLWFRVAGAHIVNMTQYPEVVLASELGIGTVNLSFVTDADAGLAPAEPGADAAASALEAHLPETALTETALTETALPGTTETDAVTAELVFARLAAAQPRILAAIDGILRGIPAGYAPRTLIDPELVRTVLDRPVRPVRPGQPTRLSTETATDAETEPGTVPTPDPRPSPGPPPVPHPVPVPAPTTEPGPAR